MIKLFSLILKVAIVLLLPGLQTPTRTATTESVLKDCKLLCRFVLYFFSYYLSTTYYLYLYTSPCYL